MAKQPNDRELEGLSVELPINILPSSNEEYIPNPPTELELQTFREANRVCAEAADRLGMDRRRFLRSSAAFALTMSAIDRVARMSMGGAALAEHKGEHGTDPLNACDVDFHDRPARPPGEFVMDLQTHHVDSGGDWRIRNPGEAAFFAAVWGQSSCGEVDREECLGRYHYLKELFLDSDTDVTVLSAVPYQPDGQPLPIEEAAETCGIIRSLAGGTERAVMHRFVMPNRGGLGHTSDQFGGNLGADPLFLQEEMDLMEYTAAAFPDFIRAWKVYCPWGDVPNASGWWLDDPCGRKFIEHAIDLGNRYNIPKLICSHKGFALPTFDQEKAATRDVGRVARMYPEMNFIIYHSGYDGDGVGLGGPINQGTSTAGPYPGEAAAPSINRGVDNFITALRENGWSARHFVDGGTPQLPFAAGEGDPSAHGNVPNVFGELGSVWDSVGTNANRASYLLGKLIYYVGPQRVVWGTDCLWTGSPQGQIYTMRAFDSGDPLFPTFKMRDDIKALYNLPFGINGDRFDPTVDTRSGDGYLGRVGDPSWPSDGLPHHERSIRNGILGRNAAVPYNVDADATRAAIACSDVQKIRDEYLLNPTASNHVPGPRTYKEVMKLHKEDAWYNGATLRLNELGLSKRLGF